MERVPRVLEVVDEIAGHRKLWKSESYQRGEPRVEGRFGIKEAGFGYGIVWNAILPLVPNALLVPFEDSPVPSWILLGHLCCAV